MLVEAALYLFVSHRRRHTRGALVTVVQTWALPISPARGPGARRLAGARGPLGAAARRINRPSCTGNRRRLISRQALRPMQAEAGTGSRRWLSITARR